MGKFAANTSMEWDAAAEKQKYTFCVFGRLHGQREERQELGCQEHNKT